MKIRICTVTGRLDESNLTKKELDELLSKGNAVEVKCFGQKRFFANPRTFSDIQEPSPKLSDLFANTFSNGNYYPRTLGVWAHGEYDPTRLDIENVGGIAVDPMRKWKVVDFEEK